MGRALLQRPYVNATIDNKRNLKIINKFTTHIKPVIRERTKKVIAQWF